MKKMHIIGVVLVAAAIVLIMSASKDMSTYATFADAEQSKEHFRVVGTLAKDQDIYYNPEVDPNYFSFFMNDREGQLQKVILTGAKPQDFEQSEQVVVIGKMVEDEFMANDILIKCPSKYKDEESALKSPVG